MGERTYEARLLYGDHPHKSGPGACLRLGRRVGARPGAPGAREDVGYDEIPVASHSELRDAVVMAVNQYALGVKTLCLMKAPHEMK